MGISTQEHTAGLFFWYSTGSFQQCYHGSLFFSSCNLEHMIISWTVLSSGFSSFSTPTADHSVSSDHWRKQILSSCISLEHWLPPKHEWQLLKRWTRKGKREAGEAQAHNGQRGKAVSTPAAMKVWEGLCARRSEPFVSTLPNEKALQTPTHFLCMWLSSSRLACIRHAEPAISDNN